MHTIECRGVDGVWLIHELLGVEGMAGWAAVYRVALTVWGEGRGEGRVRAGP